MPEKSLPTDQILTLLKTAPPRLTALSGDVDPAELNTRPTPEDWSANDVLAHLRSCADVWGGCIETILSQENPTIRATNPRTYINQTNYLEQPFAASLRAYARQRARLIKRLESLSPRDWTRTATVTGAGKPLKRSIHFYAQWMATHERPHIKQIATLGNTLGK